MTRSRRLMRTSAAVFGRRCSQTRAARLARSRSHGPGSARTAKISSPAARPARSAGYGPDGLVPQGAAAVLRGEPEFDGVGLNWLFGQPQADTGEHREVELIAECRWLIRKVMPGTRVDEQLYSAMGIKGTI